MICGIEFKKKGGEKKRVLNFPCGSGSVFSKMNLRVLLLDFMNSFRPERKDCQSVSLFKQTQNYTISPFCRMRLTFTST